MEELRLSHSFYSPDVLVLNFIVFCSNFIVAYTQPHFCQDYFMGVLSHRLIRLESHSFIHGCHRSRP